MGTHPIFESDFDCLTDMNRRRSQRDVPDPESSPPIPRSRRRTQTVEQTLARANLPSPPESIELNKLRDDLTTMENENQALSMQLELTNKRALRCENELKEAKKEIEKIKQEKNKKDDQLRLVKSQKRRVESQGYRATVRGEAAAKRLGKCCREMVRAMSRITASCANSVSPFATVVMEDIYKDGTLVLCAQLIMQLLQIEEVEFVGDKAKTEKEEQREILHDLLRLLAGSLNLTPIRNHFAHSTNFTPFVNELLAFLLDPEPNSNQLFAEDQMIKNAITELLCVIAKCDQGILTVQKFRSDFKKTQSAIAEFIFNDDRNPTDLQIAHFLKLFVLISTEGERASEFGEHFPISFIEKWSKSNCRELSQVVAILKNSSFVQSSCQ